MGITGTGNGGVLVSPPTCVPARYGLLSVADLEDKDHGHWESGIEYELETCDDLFVMTPKCNQTVPDLEKEVDDGTVSFDNFGDPFTMIAAYQCGTVGRPLAEAWEHADARLDRGEARSLERTFWTGKDKGGNDIRQSLGANPDVVDLTPAGSAISIVAGLGILESWAGEMYPCEPIIHVQRGLGVYLGQANAIASEDEKVQRVKGTGSRVAVGGGYLATGPDGDVPVAGESWMFVTGSIKVLRSPKFFTPNRGDGGAAVDRIVNDVTVFAERTYAIEQDCIVGAVRVLLQSCCG
jgi:hypothetical protein